MINVLKLAKQWIAKLSKPGVPVASYDCKDMSLPKIPDARYYSQYDIQDLVYIDNPFIKLSENAMRKEQDNYPTPELLANVISKYVLDNYFKPNEYFHILEPACGEGAFIKALKFHAPITSCIYGWDIRDVPQIIGATIATEFDALKALPTGIAPGTKLIITNPPYSIMDEFVEHMLEISPPECVCAFLLPLRFLAGKNRAAKIYEVYGAPFELVPVVPRPSFVDGKTANDEYGLFIWVSGSPTDQGVVSKPLTWK